jgi:outer membrane murein-binding lipoprotein Lpp
MKLVNYQLQTQIEYLSDENKPNNEFFKKYLQGILEDTSKPYYQRADYIGLSMQEIKSKIDTLSSDISELQALKKKLSNALEIAKVQVAEIFASNGIDRIDGNIISSLTLTNPTSKTKDEIIIKNEEALINLGYVKFSVDIEAIEKALQTKEGKKELKKYVEVMPITVTTPAKIKVNTKRVAVSNVEAIEVDEILVIEQQMEDEYKNEYKKLAA